MRFVLSGLCLMMAGCFVQASAGAQRSQGIGAWAANGGLLAGIQVDIGKRVSVAAAGELSASGYANKDGDGYVVAGPVTGVVRARVLDHERRAIAIVGELSLPPGWVHAYEGGRYDKVQDGRVTRGFLGAFYERRYRRGGGSIRLYAGAGAQALFISGPSFDDTATYGGALTAGWSISARALGHLVDRLSSNCQEPGDC